MKNLSKTTKLLIALVFSGSMSIGFWSFTASDDYFEISKNLSIFSSIYKELNVFYVDETSPGDLMKTGIDAMLKSLDPYTTYIPESDIEDYRFQISGEYGGIGALIRKVDEGIVITEPYEGFPAQKVGLMAGDIITEVDGIAIAGKTTQEVSEILKGQSGTNVVISVKRPIGNDEFETFEEELVREEVKIPDVPYYGMIDDKTGYVKLTSFTQTASMQVRAALVELKENEGMEQVIFDLRGNGGGLLTQAVEIVNLFIARDELVVETKGRIDEMNTVYKTLNSPWDEEIPLVVLVDGGSASASEIVSGSFQDLDRGVIIGERTYGKGLVQQTKDIDFGSMLKLTIAKYYIPSGRCIQELDYSARVGGEVHEVADSLLKAFKTRNGRMVYDGRGISPDVIVDLAEYSRLTATLMAYNYIFNYATQYQIEHATIAPADEYAMTDDEYEDFIQYLEDKEYEYTTMTEEVLADLEKIAENEKYLEGFAEEYEQLVQMMHSTKSTDLSKFKTEILELLQNEIVSRYYYQTGRVEFSLANDPYIREALELFANPDKYNQILSGTQD